jgi:hypothetical protein
MREIPRLGDGDEGAQQLRSDHRFLHGYRDS